MNYKFATLLQLGGYEMSIFFEINASGKVEVVGYNGDLDLMEQGIVDDVVEDTIEMINLYRPALDSNFYHAAIELAKFEISVWKAN